MSHVNGGKRPWWIHLGVIAVLGVLWGGNLASVEARHGYYGHGYRQPSVVIVPRVVVPFGPFWTPYAYPPVAVSPPPVYVQPPPRMYFQAPPPQPQYWYYCDQLQGYYPYVQECPSGWRQVSPTPPP